MNHAIPLGLKRFINVVGIILIVIGLPFAVNLFCGVPLMAFDSYGGDAAYYGVFSLLAFALTMGVGLAMFTHSNRSIENKPSKPLKFFPIPLMVGAFSLLMAFGLFFSSADATAGIFFPPVLLALAALPPLWSVAWFMGKDESRRLKDEGKIQNSEIGKTEDDGEDVSDEESDKRMEVNGLSNGFTESRTKTLPPRLSGRVGVGNVSDEESDKRMEVNGLSNGFTESQTKTLPPRSRQSHRLLTGSGRVGVGNVSDGESDKRMDVNGLSNGFMESQTKTLPPRSRQSHRLLTGSGRFGVGNVSDGESDKRMDGVGITWRRGMMAFIGGATIGVFVALVLEIILPTIVLSLAFNLSKVVLNSVGALLDALAGSDVARTLTDRGFIYVFIQLALIAPLAEEFAKPLAVIPLLKRASRRDAFLLGALAGAGFAALENVVYTMGGFDIWGGVLLLRSLGGALHPLGAGLMALAWRDVLNNEQAASSKWFGRFAIAVGVHAVWNGGSLLVIAFGAGLFGRVMEIGILGISAAGTTLAFLILLGISALWMGRVFGQGESPNLFPDKADVSFAPSERSLAIWALACLTAIVPIGVMGLSLWLR